MKKAGYFLSFFLLLLLPGLACSLTDFQGTQNAILFADDFSDASKKWNRVLEDSGSADYYDSAYRIFVNPANANIWANPANENFIDTRIEVDATKIAGPDDNDFGIICRYEDASRFYFAVISSDGYYGVLKMTPEGVRGIGKDTLLESNTINPGAATNHVRFDCVGSTLTLYVNNTQVDQQIDADYSTGNVGLLAGSFTAGGTDILFDNFIVYRP